jgi:hypothetical protein
MGKATMTKKFPANLRSLVDQAICNLWDKNCPLPDLSPLGEWLEVDGWDYVVDGIYSSYADMEVLKEFLCDEMLIEYDYTAHTSEITDAIRLEFARQKIDHLLSESMDSMHVIELESENMPPAVLCILMYYHGQGGASFYSIDVDFSAEDYIESFKEDIILYQHNLSDQQILSAWMK